VYTKNTEKRRRIEDEGKKRKVAKKGPFFNKDRDWRYFYNEIDDKMRMRKRLRDARRDYNTTRTTRTISKEEQ
jgi:hypothetical protein